MTESTEDNKFEQVVHKIDPQSKLLRTWELKGGISARVTVLEIERPDGHTQKMVVRQHGDVDLKHNPNIAADEFKLLQLLQSVGVAAPMPYHLDQSGFHPAASNAAIQDSPCRLLASRCILSASTRKKICRKVERTTYKC